MRDAANGEEWKRIAEQVANEADSEKLALLVKELCDAFDLAGKKTRPGSLDQGQEGVDPQAGTRPQSERSAEY